MSLNPLIAELHEIRRQHAEAFDYDLDAIFADLQRRVDASQPLISEPLEDGPPLSSANGVPTSVIRQQSTAGTAFA